MTEASIIGINDAGSTDIRDKSGQAYRVGLLVFFVSINEAAPVPVTAYYPLCYQDSVFKMLNRITFVQPETPGGDTSETEQIQIRHNPGLKEPG